MGGVLIDRGLWVTNRAWPLALLIVSLFAVPLPAQSTTAGSLRGSVRASDGPLSGAVITIEDQSGGVVRELASNDAGGFAVGMMPPGTYSILVEVAGYQPVRVRGVVVAAGRATTIGVELEERPPPITSVTEVFQSGTTAGPTGRIVLERELRTLDFRPDATDLSRSLSAVAPPMDGRAGYAVSAGGLPGRMTQVFADGVPELLMRHPGHPGEPAGAAAFSREAVTQAQVTGATLQTEWRGNPGSTLSLITRSGTNSFGFAPAAWFSSAKAFGKSELNPADSSGSSFRVSAALGGPIKRDTAHFFLHGSYSSIETPSPDPWVSDEATFQGTPVSLRETAQAIATDRYSTSLASAVFPVVRTRKGGSGLGRVDWRVGRSSQFMVRAGAASFTETNPLLGADAGQEAGAELVARDLSASAAFTTMGNLPNELRVGVAMARRDWRAASLPTTRLVAEGVRFGGNPALPGFFEAQTISVSDALEYQTRYHVIRVGASLDYANYRQRYDYGSAGVFLFGDLDHFHNGTGVFYRTESANSEVKFGAPLIGLFFQDIWRLAPSLDLLLGLRYETQILPRNRIAPNATWFTSAGIRNDSVPKDRLGIQPRLGFVHDPGNRGDWIIQGGVGFHATGMDLAYFAEAIQNSGGNVRVRRGARTFDTWPVVHPTTAAALDAPTRLTMFSDSRRYRAPRTFKGDLAITRSLRGGVTLQLSGGYHHSDYLLRRADLNLAPSSSGQSQDGRPVWGTLIQQGGLVTVATGTSRRFAEFDLVTLFSPTGFSDHYEVTASVSRPLGRSVGLGLEYTFSRTRDNLTGLLQPDPADQLSPFPRGIEGVDWDEGTSDLDIPHRAAATVELRSGAVSVAARGRWRSGLPFTPGFRSGVDVNGDLGGNNDPAPADAVVNPSGPGVVASCDRNAVAGFAARNSCRENGIGSLDLQLGVTLPFGLSEGRRLMLMVDAFNIVASRTGVVDRAALLIDPDRNLATDPSTGAVTIPFSANPRFGTLLRRGGEPRLLRLGLRVE